MNGSPDWPKRLSWRWQTEGFDVASKAPFIGGSGLKTQGVDWARTVVTQRR